MEVSRSAHSTPSCRSKALLSLATSQGRCPGQVSSLREELDRDTERPSVTEDCEVKAPVKAMPERGEQALGRDSGSL